MSQEAKQYVVAELKKKHFSKVYIDEIMDDEFFQIIEDYSIHQNKSLKEENKELKDFVKRVELMGLTHYGDANGTYFALQRLSKQAEQLLKSE